MRYGLGQIDLNLQAQLALMGLSDTPERDIAELLRSGQPIEEKTRQRLADALEGKAKRIHLKAVGLNASQSLRSLQSWRRNVQIGKAIDALIPDLGYDAGIKHGAITYSTSEKSIVSYLAWYRKMRKWIAAIREAREHEHLSDFALEVAFLYAKATRRKPAECLSSDAGEFADFIAWTDELESKTGLRRHPSPRYSSEA
jgi:hypothetical protein